MLELGHLSQALLRVPLQAVRPHLILVLHLVSSRARPQAQLPALALALSLVLPQPCPLAPLRVR
jgi:hypothetical protein